MRAPALRKLLAIVIAAGAAVAWLWQRGRRQPDPLDRPGLFAASAGPTPPVQPANIAPADAPQPAPQFPPQAVTQRIALVALVVSLGLAFAGQAVFAEGHLSPNIPTGIALFAAAIVAFTFAITRLEKADRVAHPAAGEDEPHTHRSTNPLRATLDAIRRRPQRALGLAIVAVMIAALLDLLAADPPLPDFTLPFLLWLGAIGLYVRVAVTQSARAPKEESPWWRANPQAALILILILLVAFTLRVWDLEGIPPTLAGDEGTFGLESVKTITGEWPHRNPFTTGWLSVPTMSFFFNSLTIRLFGQGVFALRLPWALVGTVTVLLVFQLVRRLTNLTLALMTAGLLATYHFHVHYSRLGINNAADPLLIALVIYLLFRAIDRRDELTWALCGAATGVAQYFYFGARFAVIVVGVLVAYLAVRGGRRFLREHTRGMVIMAGAAIVAAAPMIQYAIRFPLDYNARFNQIGIIGPSGWLEREMQIRGQGALPILLDQLQRAGLAFNVYPDRTGWYGLARSIDGKIQQLPLFDFASGILFLLGLGYATLRPFERRLFPMVVWWWGAMILGGALTESPPSTQRLVTLGAPAVFFVSLALLKIGQTVQRAWRTEILSELTPYLAAAVVALSLTSVRLYFIEFTPLRVFGTFNAVVATDMAHYMRDWLGPDWRVYFFGPRRIYIEFGTIPYIAPDVEGVDIVEPLTAALDPGVVQPDKHAAFIFLPERRAELDFVRQTFPEGDIVEIPSYWEGDPNPLFIVYRVRLSPTH
jgi:hypothetical protein